MDYKPLDIDRNEIRLLQLLPGEKYTTVHATLEHASLINPPPFNSLSYCWGDASVTSEVIINNNHVQVTTNLESALRHLRDKGLETLWVDAVCINQDDKMERNQQLLWMGSIYRRAREIHVWTGEAEEDFNRTFSRVTSETITDSGKESWSEESDAALLQFLSRPYWRRVWIVQELAFSRTIIVHCGEKETSMEALERRISEVNNDSLKLNQAIINMLNLIQFQLDTNDMKPVPLIEALFRTQAALSTDPRDKVFALLGLAYDTSLYVPIPNYKQSREDLAMAITISAVATTGKCNVLAFLAPRQDNSLGLPTWAVDWFHMENDKGRGVRYLTAHRGHHRILPTYHADGNQRSNISFISSVLHIQGIVFDEIDGTCPTAGEFQKTSTLASQHQSMYTETTYESKNLWEHVASCFTRYFGEDIPFVDNGKYTAEAVQKALAEWYILLNYLVKYEPAEGSKWIQEGPEQKAIAWLLYSSGFNVSGKTLLELAWESECMYDLMGRDEFSFGNSRKEERIADLVRGHAEATLAPVLDDNMRFMTTKKGYVGWSHIRGKRGDQICILEGCSVPVILRAREEGGYTLVGDAFVSGIMDGEASGGPMETIEIH